MTKAAATKRGARPDQQPDSAAKSLVSMLATIGVPVTVAAALMYYFGWAHSRGVAKLHNLNESLYSYSAEDYIIRGIAPVFQPLLWLGVIGLAWLGLHQAVLKRLAIPRWRPLLRSTGQIAFGVGVIVAAVALLASATFARVVGPWAAVMATPARTLVAQLPLAAGPEVAPFSIAVGTAVAGYSLWLVRAATPAADRHDISMGQRVLRAGLIGGIIALAMFWGLGRLAVESGVATSSQELQAMPRAIAYSAAPLGVHALGVREDQIGLDPPLWRTTGLRLMGRSGGRMFLLHDGWTPEQGAVIVVPDDGKVIWQFFK